MSVNIKSNVSKDLENRLTIQKEKFAQQLRSENVAI